MEVDRIAHGDCLEILETLEENSIDAIVTDPPYELGFMGKKWDSTGIAFNIEVWQKCLKVLKPGGHMLAFGGSRTFHRIAVAIEDAGFELRDTIMWVYGSGFPKSLDVSKAIDKLLGKEAERKVVGQHNAPAKSIYSQGKKDLLQEVTITTPATPEAKQYEGFGTALKPAFEPIIVARKPLEGTVADNVLKWGTGGINIDDCRVETDDTYSYPNGPGGCKSGNFHYQSRADTPAQSNPLGRWPANFIHDGSDEVLELFPETTPSKQSERGKVEIFKKENSWIGESTVRGHNDSESAARFFYCAKASRKERGEGNNHPTVKPLALMQYLVRLVTPPNGIVLDPFTGSGSTLIAAMREGFKYIGIELNEEYIEIVEKRLQSEQPLFEYNNT